MDSNTHQIYEQKHQSSSGLLRFRSAPSSILANFPDNGVGKGGFESDRLISSFMSSNEDLDCRSLRVFKDQSPGSMTDAAAAFAATSQPPPPLQQQSYSGLPPHYPRQNDAVNSSAVEGSYQFLAVNHQAKSEDSNLVRQSSLPAGLFTNLSVQNGYSSMRSMISYGPDGELSPSSNGFKLQPSIPSRPSSSLLGMQCQISEIGSDNITSGFQYGPWNDPSGFMANSSGVKRETDSDMKLFSGDQNGEEGNRSQLLSHHLSLPRTSAEMVAVESNFLQLQDSVPCKIRAKRGCATHPRSIAERVRRTRISERMRKLQELVPNMDKQTSTSDMLDLAVEYIRDLQQQFKTLSDSKANCKCLDAEEKL